MATWTVGIAGRCSGKFDDSIPPRARRRYFLWVMVHVWATMGTFGRALEPGVHFVSQLVSTEVVDETRGDGGPMLFSASWAEKYRLAAPGCKLGRGSYTWRKHGFGSNMNNMLNAWVYALSVEKWNDLALVTDSSQLGEVDCTKENHGQKTGGWRCLFDPMPHLCSFDSNENWVDYMNSRRVSEADRQEAVGLTLDAVRKAPDLIVESLEETEVDHLGALAAMANYLWSYMTPWLKADIDVVTNQNIVEGFGEAPFIGIHVRRGDKLKKEAHRVETEEYLAAAAEYFLNTNGTKSVDEIEGIWLASDDSGILDEVRTLCPKYFPNVRDPEKIVWVSADAGVATYSDRQSYRSMVYLFADLKQLSLAEIFVGTFSSNLGRLTAVLREGNGKERSSAISVDSPTWNAGRRGRRDRRQRRALGK